MNIFYDDHQKILKILLHHNVSFILIVVTQLFIMVIEELPETLTYGSSPIMKISYCS
jgi:hypothetical protein